MCPTQVISLFSTDILSNIISGGRNPVEGLIELKEGLDKIPKHIAFILLGKGSRKRLWWPLFFSREYHQKLVIPY